MLPAGWDGGIEAQQLEDSKRILKRMEGLISFVTEEFLVIEGEVLKHGLDFLWEPTGLHPGVTVEHQPGNQGA